MENLPNWKYNGIPFTDTPEDKEGFIYLIEFTNGKRYIGKKNFYVTKTLPALKSGKRRDNSDRIGKNINGKRVYFDVIKKESDWRKYIGSSKHIDGLTVKRRTILEIAHSKRYLTYLEAKYLFTYEVLETEEYLNDNILGSFFDNIKD